MHPVHAPEDWHTVHEHMLAPDGQVEQDEGGQTDKPDRHRHQIEEPKTNLVGKHGDTGKPCRQDQPPERRPCDKDERRTGPALHAAKGRRPARCQCFEGCQRGKDAGEHAYPDENVMVQLLK